MYKYLKYKEGKIIIKKTYFPKLIVFAGLCVNIPYDIQIHSAKNKITKISMKKVLLRDRFISRYKACKGSISQTQSLQKKLYQKLLAAKR